ncbi:MAG: S41 family peptidase [Flavobacteriales bacterium]|nr:S41 family peptidase [Flavobacteriales bacterium]
MERILFTLVLLYISFAVNSQGDLNTISTKQKIYGLSKFWQEVNYNFAFFDQVPNLNWDSAYQSYIQKVSQTTNDLEYYNELQRFCALLKDGHTNIYLPKRLDSLILQNSYAEFSFQVKNLEGGVYVIKADKHTAKELPLGSEIIEVNGQETEVYLKEKVIPLISSSTSHILWNWAVERMFWGTEGTYFDIKIRTPKGEFRRLRLTLAKDKRRLKTKDNPLYEFKWLDNKIAYVSLNSFSKSEIISEFEESLSDLHQAKAYILDLRKNGGGMTDVGTNILKYFTNKEYVLGSTWKTREHVAAYKAWGSPIPTIGWKGDEQYRKYLEGNSWIKGEHDTLFIADDFPKLLKPMVVLISNNTASAAEDFMIYLDYLGNRAKVFGQPTFGSTGQPLIFEMPGGGYARVCTKRDTYPDGRDFVGYGIQPDVEILETVSDYILGKDATLDQAIEYLKKEVKN